MSFTNVAEPLSSVQNIQKADYYTIVSAKNLVWFFSKEFVNQPNFNYGHRVSFAGGHAVSFDTVQKTWGKLIEYSAVSTEENTVESFFEFNGEVYLLLANNFGSVNFRSLFKWTGSSFEELKLKAPSAKAAFDEQSRIEVVVSVSSPSSTQKPIVIGMNSGYYLYNLAINGNEGEVTFVDQAPEDLCGPGLPVSAFEGGHRVYISYGVHGCGFMWQSNSLIAYNKETKSFQNMMFSDDSQGGPPFFSGPFGVSIASNGEVVHMAGSKRVGMCGSEFVGDIFALTGLAEGNPSWIKKSLRVPEEGDGLVLTSNDDLFAFGSKNVMEAHLD